MKSITKSVYFFFVVYSILLTFKLIFRNIASVENIYVEIVSIFVLSLMVAVARYFYYEREKKRQDDNK